MFDRIKRINAMYPLEIPELFAHLRETEIFDSFCDCVIQRLNEESTFDEAWSYAVEQQKITRSYFAVVELIKFSSAYSVGSAKDQCDLCEYYQDLCNGEMNTIELFINKNNKLMICGSILFGSLLLIMLC